MKTKIIISLTFLILCTTINIKAQNQYELLYLQNNLNLIIEVANKNIESQKSNPNDYYWCSNALYEIQQLDKTIETIEQGLAKFPSNARLTKLLSNVYYESGNYTKAIPILQSLRQDTESQINLARIYEFNNDNYTAIKIFEKLYANDTTNILYLKHLGNNYNKIDSITKAIAFYKRTLIINPNDQPTAIKLSRIFLKKNKFNESIAACNTILSNDSTNLKFLKQKGFVYFKFNKHKQAIEMFLKVIALGDTSAFTLKYIGIAELHSANFHKGREHLLRAYSQDSIDFNICYFLGRAYLNSKEKEIGLDYLDKADTIILSTRKTLIAIYQERASIYSELKQYDNELKCHKISYELSNEPEYLFYSASVYMVRKKDNRKALELYERFLRELPPKQNPERIKNNKNTISLKSTAEFQIKKLKEKLFFERQTTK